MTKFEGRIKKAQRRKGTEGKKNLEEDWSRGTTDFFTRIQTENKEY